MRFTMMIAALKYIRITLGYIQFPNQPNNQTIHYIISTHCSLQKKLRTYPVGFADAMVRLLPSLSAGEGCPPVIHDKSPEDVLEGIPVLRYLRGNRHLDLPLSWKNAFPRPLEILQKLEEDKLARRCAD